MGKRSITAVICLVICFLSIAAAYVFLEENRDMVIIAGGIVVGFAVMVCISIILGNTFVYSLRCRRAALKAMGKDGFTAVMKDEVAKTAYKGIYKMIKGDYAAAEEQLMQALSMADVRQNQLFCIEWLVRLYETTSDDSKLMWCYRKAADYAPDNPEIQSRLGHSYYVEGKLDKAMYCFEQALHYDPNHGYSGYSIAKIHIARGEDDIAVQKLTELAKVQENHPLVFAELATVLAMKGDEEKSREYFQKAILLGYNEPDKLAARMTAICEFNKASNADGNDLPQEYYRRIQKNEEEKRNCSSCSCEYCSLDKSVKGEDNAGDE